MRVSSMCHPRVVYVCCTHFMHVSSTCHVCVIHVSCMCVAHISCMCHPCVIHVSCMCVAHRSYNIYFIQVIKNILSALSYGLHTEGISFVLFTKRFVSLPLGFTLTCEILNELFT